MNLIDRARNILVKPKPEWEKISLETPNVQSIMVGYVLPLALLSAVAAFIGYAFVGDGRGVFRIKSTDLGIYFALRVLIGSIGSVFISAFIIDVLAPSFESEKNMGRSIQLVAYSYTPSLIGGIFAIIPSLSVLGLIAAIYGLYLMYIGLPPMKKTKEDKQGVYFVVSLVTMLVVYLIVFMIVERILGAIFGNLFSPFNMDLRL